MARLAAEGALLGARGLLERGARDLCAIEERERRRVPLWVEELNDALTRSVERFLRVGF